MAKQVNISIKTDGLLLEAVLEVKSFSFDSITLTKEVVKSIEKDVVEALLRVVNGASYTDQHTSEPGHQSPSEHQQGKHPSVTLHD
jgi:hypothetical protein